jgi:hypothetical protein
MSTTRPIDFNSRFNEYKTKCNNLKEIYNIKDEVKLDIGGFNSGPSTDRWTKTVTIPISFLLKVEDIPAQFRVSGLEDPRINDENFLRQVAQWLNTKISEGFGSTGPQVKHSDVQKMFLWMNDPALFEKSKDFVFAHEVAHCSQSLWREVALSAAWIGGGIVLSIVFFLNPIPAAVLIAVASVMVVAQVASAIFLSRFHEKEADLKAAEALKDASGGIYENNHSLEWNQQLLAQESCPRWIKWTHDAEGNFLLDVLHPSLTERNKYLREWSPSTQSRREVLV